jgi:hypothetical protein
MPLTIGGRSSASTTRTVIGPLREPAAAAGPLMA